MDIHERQEVFLNIFIGLTGKMGEILDKLSGIQCPSCPKAGPTIHYI